MSGGALVLVVLGAPAASAAVTAAPKPCPKGVDPASTIENWKCQLGNLRESLMPSKKPQTTPTPTPSKKAPLKQSSGGTTKKSSTSSSGKSRTGGGGTGGQAPTGTGPAPLNRSVQPYSSAPTTPNLPGVLPTPEVAADPNAYQNRPAGAAPQTRLISPVAATGPDDGQVAWVAAAAAAAGAVGALNISVLGRRLRRRAEHGG